uniref:Retrovirus-related Pol polyprotein from transposon TNT 1-94-like beta-barrel domain-containing protein n=1 Tax=Oryza sativa subsp. japonica TaxID=39947 RepID=Q2QZP1_ORYSJ|nr:hypothetical protein LOC_Os11g45320 [Oryza sativa Japonica Group]
MAPRKRSHPRRKPEERANVNVSSLNNIFISAEPGATFPRWFITEAATNHMTSDKSIFSDLKPMAGLVIDDRAGAGAGLPMHGIGAVYSWEVALQDVWYVPGMSAYIGLVSAGQLTAIGLKTEIAGDVCTITSADGSEVGKGRMACRNGRTMPDHPCLPHCSLQQGDPPHQQINNGKQLSCASTSSPGTPQQCKGKKTEIAAVCFKKETERLSRLDEKKERKALGPLEK